MKLSRNNYESYLVDYLDGKLSPLQVAELLLFLEQNPDLKTEFEGIEEFSINESSSVQYPYKDLLKKNASPTSINDSTIEQFIIRKIENELSNEEIVELNNYLKHNKSAQQELFIFEKAILNPNLSVVFSEKNALKREAKIIPLFYRIASVAAIFLLLVSTPFFFKLLTDKADIKNQVASSQISANEQIEQRDFKKTKHSTSSTGLKTPAVNVKIRKQKAAKNQNINSIERRDIQPTLSQTKTSLDSLINSTAQVTPIVKTNELVEINPSVIQEVAPLFQSEEPKYLSLKDMAERKIKDLSKDNLEEVNANGVKSHKTISAWDFAAIAAKLVGKISGNSIKVQNKYNSEGELTQYAIVSNNFEFSKGK